MSLNQEGDNNNIGRTPEFRGYRFLGFTIGLGNKQAGELLDMPALKALGKDPAKLDALLQGLEAGKGLKAKREKR